LVLEKGIPELIEAAESLNGDEFVLVIVGPHDPDKSDAIPDELMNRGVRAGVRFLGMRTDVERLYGGFDLFVLPSHREGFPRAAMEAAASGLPVVATDIRGCRQVVDNGETGFLFPVGDAQALAHAVRTLGSDLTRLREFGAASARKARREFDEEDVVEKVMSTYRMLALRRGLAWKNVDVEEVELRAARAGDENAIAELHRQMIATGFLSSLGHRFLRVLYEAMIGDDGCTVVVAESNGVVVGFIAGTESTGRLYKRFLRAHWFKAALSMFPAILKPSMWKRMYESFRYGSDESRFDAELLSMAVAPAARRRRVGKRLVDSLLSWAEDQGIQGMKVVVAESNRPATALYNSCGFVEGRQVEVHADTASWEFIWSA
ncbi:MAG: GNAT family N-acetyltransferase, partial [Acidimicrobiia bacterium]